MTLSKRGFSADQIIEGLVLGTITVEVAKKEEDGILYTIDGKGPEHRPSEALSDDVSRTESADDSGSDTNTGEDNEECFLTDSTLPGTWASPETGRFCAGTIEFEVNHRYASVTTCEGEIDPIYNSGAWQLECNALTRNRDGDNSNGVTHTVRSTSRMEITHAGHSVLIVHTRQ